MLDAPFVLNPLNYTAFEGNMFKVNKWLSVNEHVFIQKLRIFA